MVSRIRARGVRLVALATLSAAAAVGCTGTIEDPQQNWGPSTTPTADATQVSDTTALPDGTTTGPDGTIGPDGTVTHPCPDDQTYFETVIWDPIMAVDCANCHSESGLAQTSRMVFRPDMTTQERMDVMRVLAEDVSVGGVPMLLLKPTMQVLHGGFQRFTVGDDKYQAFVELIHRFGSPDSCDDITEPDVLCQFDGTVSPGPSPLRRLTSEQYANSVAALFWPSIDLGTYVPDTDAGDGYRTYATANSVSQAVADGLFDAAELVSAQAVATPGDLIACAPNSGDIPASCVTEFIQDFGFRVFRRPLTSEEAAIFETLASQAADGSAATVLGMLIEAFLQSPQFLYMDMTGANPVAGQSDIQELEHFAVASRLSYLLWNTMPDQELFDLASAGQLQDPAVLEAQVVRMLADDRGRLGVLAFHQDWVRTGRLPTTKDANLFPDYDTALRGMMREEISRFVEHVVFDVGGTFHELMTMTDSFVTADLDGVYGVNSGSSGANDWQLTDLGQDRRGILTRAGFLAGHATSKTSSPIKRGVFVVERLFCQNLVPPPTAEMNVGEPAAGETIADVIAKHRQDPQCASCHDQIDPIGLGFENYDSVGAWRTMYDSGLPVEADGYLTNPNGTFADASGLIDLLMSSDIVRNCYATHWFRYTSGRSNTSEDICALTTIHQRFAQTGGDIQDLIVGIVLSDAFRYRVDKDLQVVEP